MARAWISIAAIVAPLAAIGCDEDELAPPRAPSDVAPTPTCVEGAPPPAPPPIVIAPAAFTPQLRPRTIVIPLDGLQLYADTPEGAWLNGLQPPSRDVGWPFVAYRYDRAPGYAPHFRRWRRRR